MARVVLVGFMCAGKSEVGRRLAARLGWAHVDLDRLVEVRAGRRVAEIFAIDGEAAFRALEARVTREVAGWRHVVVSPGGGWVKDPALRGRMGPGTVEVWLQVSAEEVVRRAAAHPGERPLLAGPDPLAAARRLLAEREPLYARAAHRVDTGGRTPDEVAAEVERRLRLAPSASAGAAGPVPE